MAVHAAMELPLFELVFNNWVGSSEFGQQGFGEERSHRG
jgi:hypothetical protein